MATQNEQLIAILFTNVCKPQRRKEGMREGGKNGRKEGERDLGILIKKVEKRYLILIVILI